MMLSARRVVLGAVGAGAMTGAMLFGASSAAAAPNCTAADLAGVAAGVSASTSAYLFTHPEVNDFFTSLEGKDRDTIKAEVHDYMEAHPQVKAELTGIRQPLTDLKNRCGHNQDPAAVNG
ncbi:heme-binding protein [[Mycobacterium] wendilense]|uniref:Heme-binding protein n=1 Tax=[Mycobacterium] wendilense TaxID=3064284 RepID=A0ABM9MJ44_9MYCO|nr:heme-binding protein [Mycolicibacterium sp. MU0050]CAJ1586409.1 heme-binding protein [Mycolicibacterium sp. MU0050]